MTALPAGTYYALAQDRVDRMLAAHKAPFTSAVVAAERSWLPVEQLLAPTFRWPADVAPTAWLDDAGLTWLYCRTGGEPTADLLARWEQLQRPWFGLSGPHDGWLAIPVDVAASPLTPAPGLAVATGDWLVREAGHDRPCTDTGCRWIEAYQTVPDEWGRPRVTRAVAERIVADQARRRRARVQQLLDAGVAACTVRRTVEAELPDLRWEGDTLIHDGSQLEGHNRPEAVEEIKSTDGTYELPHSGSWRLVEPELADAVHGEL